MKIGLFLNIDGVLTEDPINLQIARLLGIEKEHSEIEDKFLEGRISPEEYNKKFIPLLQRAGFSESFMVENFSRIKMRYNHEKLLKQVDNTFLVSSGPSYFIDILSKKYNIPAGRVLCSRYQFDKKGLISKCVAPVNSRMKVKFVKGQFKKFDIVIGVAYSPEFDAIFLTPCHVRVLVDDFRLGYVCVREIDTLIELIESINNLGYKYSLKTYNKFKEFETGIDRLFHTSSYEKNVFIMTPFRENIRYRSTIKTIKCELQKYNLKGWVASDKKLHSQLWSNVQCFLLGCRFGIAIFTRDEKKEEDKVIFHDSVYNPNVSLELGYMISRGKEVLILKYKELNQLPTDMVGSLYKNFDLDNPDTTLPDIIKQWVKQL